MPSLEVESEALKALLREAKAWPTLDNQSRDISTSPTTTGGCTQRSATDRRQSSNSFIWNLYLPQLNWSSQKRGALPMEGTPDKVLTIYHCDLQLAQ
jgi:hypothetical protein